MFKYDVQGTDERIAFVDENSRILPAFEATSEQGVFAYLSVRTTSWDFDGERTDTNDALSFFLAIVLRTLDISCALWDVPNPFSRVPSELYARYITIAQPTRSNYSLDEQGIAQIHKLLFGVRLFETNIGQLLEWDTSINQMRDSTYGWQDRTTKTWARKVAQVTGETLRSRKVQYNFRKNPCWLYYRTTGKNVAVYRSSGFAARMYDFIDTLSSIRTTQAVNATAYSSESSRNVVPNASARIAQDILARLEPNMPQSLLFFPIETHFLAIGTEHLVSVRCDCGLKAFEEERERVRARRKVEEDIFFPGITFTWAAKIDDRRFELLIRDLLAVEPGIRWVRKIGQTREGDEGRDLICEWITPPAPGEPIDDRKPPVATRRVIIQCKASAKSVGKSMVQDVYDTIKHHECNGYFLAVSSQLSVPLTRFLEGLRKGSEIWTDWWTRSELEDRLRNRPEILARYPDIIRQLPQSGGT
ncbi:MAG TPA: restriction endonuclease [Kofleriaceae bacterium]